MTLKLAKNWRVSGIDINVFMGDLSTLSLSLVLVSAKDVGMLWHHWLLERVMGSYYLKVPSILMYI